MVERGDSGTCNRIECEYGDRYFAYSLQLSSVQQDLTSCLEAIISGGYYPANPDHFDIAYFTTGVGPAIGNDFEIWECQTICFDNCAPNGTVASVFAIYDLLITGPNGYTMNNASIAASDYCIGGLSPGNYTIDITYISSSTFLGTINIVVHPLIHPSIVLTLPNSPYCDGAELVSDITLSNDQYYMDLYWSIDNISISDINNIPVSLLTEGNHTICVEGIDPCNPDSDISCTTFTIGIEPSFVLTNVCNTVSIVNTTDCVGNVQDWTWNYDDGFVYIGQNPPPHVFLTGGTHAIELVILSTGGNTYTLTLSITIPSPPIGQITGANSMCSITGSDYTLTGVSPGTVNWVVVPFSAGSVFYPPNSLTATVGWANGSGNAVVIASGTDINGCDFSVSFNVDACCMPIATLPVGSLYSDPAQTTSITSYTGTWPGVTGAGAFITGQTIYIYNDLIINENTTFDQCNIFVAPGKSILVDLTKNVSFSFSNITAMCNEMWNGVLAQGTSSTINLRDSKIEQAISAVFSFQGAGVTSTNSKFYNNHQGIVAFGYNGIVPMLFEIRNSEFATTAALFIPHAGEQMHKGILLSNINNVQVGIPGLPNTNKFYNLDYGIHTVNSGMTAYNNDFTSIVTIPNSFTCVNCQCPGGTAICSQRTANSVVQRTINVGEQDLGFLRRSNRFVGSKYGVYINGFHHANIKYNNFNLTSFGVEFHDIKSRILNVLNNNFRNFNIGTGAYTIGNCQLNVRNNLYSTGMGIFGIVGNTAVYVNHLVVTPFVADISFNTIEKVRNGIYFINANGLTFSGTPNIKVTFNSISFNHLPLNQYGGIIHYGVRLENAYQVYVGNNTISKNGVNPNLPGGISYLKGVGVNNSPLTVVYENEFTRMVEGVWTFGNCYPSNFICNDHTRNYYGYNFVGPADIGDQLGTSPNEIPTGNRWINPVNINADLVGQIAQPIPGQPIHWWYRNGPFMQPSSGVLSGSLSGGFNDDQAELTLNNNFCAPLPIQPPSEERERRMGSIVRGEKLILQNTEAFALYDRLRATRQLMQNNTWLFLGQADDTTYQNYYNQSMNSTIGQLELVSEYLQQGNLSQAQNVNALVVPINNWEYYLQRSNELIIEDLMTDTLLSATDTTELTQIAYENALIGGPGVFEARARLRLDITDMPDGGTRNMEQQISKQEIPLSHFELYPNPNNGNFTIKLTETSAEETTVLIYDLTGKLVFRKSLTQGEFEIELALSNGIYLVDIWVGEINLGKQKLIITK